MTFFMTTVASRAVS